MNQALFIQLLFVLGVWLVGLLCSILALRLGASRRYRRTWLGWLVAVFTLALSWIGRGWMPGFYFPNIGYTHTNDTFELRLNTAWLFMLPMALSAVALAMNSHWFHRFQGPGSCENSKRDVP